MASATFFYACLLDNGFLFLVFSVICLFSQNNNETSFLLDMKPKVYIVIYGRGGHQEQMLRLCRHGLFKNVPNEQLIAFTDSETPITETIGKTIHFREFRDKYSRLKTLVFLPFNVIKLVYKSFEMMVRYDIRGVIVTGPGVAIIPSIIFSLFRKKLVVFETWSKYYKGSLTGRVLYRFAGLFLIQNKSLKKIYPDAQYLGRL